MTGDHAPTLSDAVRRLVRPGMTVHLAYGGGRPNAAVAEIVRQFAGTSPGFTVSAHGFVNSQVSLVAAGLVRRLVVAFAGENYPSPRPNPVLQRAIRRRDVEIENWSIWTLTARLTAAALGVDHFPVRSLAGSSLAEDLHGAGFDEVAPFGGRPTPVVSPLAPDLVLVHGLLADTDGNVLLAPPYGEGAWGALAAREGVLACVERVVAPDVLRRYNSRPIIPAHVVRAVCETPFGSHPYGLAGIGVPEVDGYGEDDAFMAELRRAARTDGDMAAWVERWVTGPANHDEFLELLGRERLAALVQEDPPDEPGPRTDDLTADERMTLAAVRLLRERVRDRDADVVLAGIGYAHLAAWTAVTGMRDAGARVELAAELGLAGLRPLPGDPYLFARRNLPGAARLADVTDVLARDVSGPVTRSIGVLGAAQVDAAGNLNSTWSANGDFILGSGGANDVASGADEVVVVLRHAGGRLVEKVDYITAPGASVSTIVTTEAVLERRDGRFVVTRWLADVPRAEAVDRIRAGLDFEALVADDVAPEPAPDARDIATLRAFDPRGVFLR